MSYLFFLVRASGQQQKNNDLEPDIERRQKKIKRSDSLSVSTSTTVKKISRFMMRSS
jgi:hypothetical protein